MKKRKYYGDKDFQYGDLRLPDSVGPFPVAVVIHGGFWRSAYGLDLMDDFCEALTAKGIATWNIEYRRVGHAGGWPGTLIDAARATDYLPKLQNDFNIDLDRVITIGHSAGGHLALWLAGRHNLPEDSELNVSPAPIKLCGAISLAGVSDLALMQEVHELRGENDPVKDFLEGSPKDVPERYAQASPIQLLPIGIQQVLIHGSLDIEVPVGISHHYIQAAKESGDNAGLIEMPSAEHYKLIDPESEAWPTILAEVKKLLDM
ncbi:acetyl esterase/lipase [Scopulibacillus darangshiensis]|uniref:Acetyl esterase/lipase n=1 Tax=Scopulibacillus darangshiensis TaxID=442528 RepID=A0A4R2NWP9_9BACL|nr:alpha/beta hydrolase [Scopulibacillus darangshiensis]TCP26609.1 acetyl esterase/lipase [Scopulibacillus darangshiensis]